MGGACDVVGGKQTEDRPKLSVVPNLAQEALSSLCLLQYGIDEKTTVTKLPQPSVNQKQILTALGVTLPAK